MRLVYEPRGGCLAAKHVDMWNSGRMGSAYTPWSACLGVGVGSQWNWVWHVAGSGRYVSIFSLVNVARIASAKCPCLKRKSLMCNAISENAKNLPAALAWKVLIKLVAPPNVA